MQKLNLNTGNLNRDRLSVVQKVDNAVVSIILTTPHVAVYIFEGNKWERKNIEGPLYLVRRCQDPEFALLVLNRKGPEHMVEPITEHFDFNDQEPYIIFRNSKATPPVPHGMWFKSPEDRRKLWHEIQSINSTLQQRKAGVGTSDVRATPSGGAANMNGQHLQQQLLSSQQLRAQVQQMMQQQHQMHAQIHQQQQILQQQQMHIQQLATSHAKPSQTPPSTPPVQGLSANEVELSMSQLKKILMRMVQDDRFVGALHAQYVKAQRKKRGAVATQGN